MAFGKRENVCWLLQVSGLGQTDYLDRDDYQDGDDDDGGGDDDNGDIYIMMQCLFVCHEK